jgi:predicted metal-dependent hydrolase
MHPIPVRKMKFDIPPADTFDSRIIAGNLVVSYTALGISLYVAYLEPFLVKSMRRVLDQITDDELRENVDRFSRQEAQHYQQHERFNRAILEAGYPGLKARFDQLKADFERFFKDKGDKWCIGFVEGFEAYTTQGALAALGSGVFDHPKTDKRWGDLFRWHLAEEIEHRNVAFDIYQHLYGSYLFRVKLAMIAQSHIINFIVDCMRIMSPVDTARRGEAYRVTAQHRLLVRAGVLPMFFRTWLPGYTPHDYEVPGKIAALTSRLTAEAESAS